MRKDEFSSLIGRHYDFYNRGWELTDDTRNDINFILHYATRAKSVLDVSAGTGRLAIPLAERGIEVVCIEPAGPMADALFVKVAQKPLIHPFISIMRGDPATFDVGRKFPLAYFYWAFIYVASDAERVRVLKRIGEHLEPGGRLIVDCNIGPQPEHEMELGRYTLGMFEYRATIQALRTPGERVYGGLMRLQAFRDGKVVESEECRFTGMDVPSFDYFKGILEESGFVLDEVFSDSDFTPHTPDHPYVVAVAKKA